MSDLICRNTMMRCQTPGMCSPHGGCRPSVLLDTNVRYSNTSAGDGADWTDERKLALKTALRLVAVEEENAQLKAENKRLTDVNVLQTVRKFVVGMSQSVVDDLVATGIRVQDEELARVKAEYEGLRATASLSRLLPELDDALEDLELHGRHSDQGYRKLKDWYRKIFLASAAIDAAMGNGERPCTSTS